MTATNTPCCNCAYPAIAVEFQAGHACPILQTILSRKHTSRVHFVRLAASLRLRASGAVLIAKLATGEMAYDDVWWGGKVKNPWNIAEGSSGSSAGLTLPKI